MPTDLPDPSAPDPRSAAPSPELTLLSDVVPRLRPDLRIEPRPNEAGLFDVAPADGAQAFTLYDFEVSIARMLDGKRSASQLIEAAGRIGIPVTLESLRKFVRQLRAYKFILEAEVPLAPSEGWAPRVEWRPEVRELFQSALRTFRNDRPTEARGYVEALLQIEPDLPEAVDLLGRIEERILSGEASPLPAFDLLHGEGEPGEALGEGEEGLGDPARAPERVSDYADEEEPSPAPPRRRWPLIALGLIAVAAAGALAVPVPARVVASVELSPAGTPSPLVSPRSGKIAEALAKPGAWVKAGQPVFRLEDTDLAQREEATKKELDRLSAQLAWLERHAKTRSVLKAKASLDRKAAQVEALTQQKDALEKRRDRRSRRRLRSVTRSLAKRQRDLSRLKKSYEKKAGVARQAALAEEKKAKEAELASVQEARAKSVLAATQEGSFQPSRRVGDPVLSGESVGTVVDARKLKVTLGVPARVATQVKEGQPVSVRVDGSRAELRTVILTTSGESAGAGLVRATARLDNPDHALEVGANGLAEIDCGTQPLFSRLFGGG